MPRNIIYISKNDKTLQNIFDQFNKQRFVMVDPKISHKLIKDKKCLELRRRGLLFFAHDEKFATTFIIPNFKIEKKKVENGYKYIIKRDRLWHLRITNYKRGKL